MAPLIQNKNNLIKAYDRIVKYVHNTPLLYSDSLNKMLKSKIYFKMDAIQKTGSFKIRGVLNHLLFLKETDALPQKIVAYSTGNHALAMAYAAKIFNITARVYLPQNVAVIKKKIAKYYGAEVIEVETRLDAEILSKKDGESGFYYMHPSDNDETIAGAGTMCLEALKHMEEKSLPKPDAIFAPCGGGGLLAGSYLAKELLSPESQLIGAEPELADDASRSLKLGRIYRFSKSPKTIADGLRALSVSERTLNYITKLDEFNTYSEESIYYWTAWLMQLTKVTCETSSAISMCAAHDWISRNKDNKTILVLISGGNIDPSLYLNLWQDGYLNQNPKP